MPNKAVDSRLVKERCPTRGPESISTAILPKEERACRESSVVQSATINDLPIELRQAILQLADLIALKAMRLVSKDWAVVGEDYVVLPRFTILPHRNDFNRLLSVSRIPKFNFRIQSLEINLGEINEYHARHNTYFLQYTRDAESRSTASEEAWSSYSQLKALKEIHLPFCCSRETLQSAMSTLPNLKSIQVTLETCPFDNELFQDIWRIPSTRLLPRVATTERFTNILSAVAANSSTLYIRNLGHDRLPFEFFAQKPTTMSHVSTAFQSLTTLKLVIDYSEMPNDLHAQQAFENLSHCLRSTQLLQSLELSFQGRRKTNISPLLSSFSENHFRFRALESLKLEGVSSPGAALGDFLLMSKRTAGVHLSSGSFKILFRRLREDMNLESLVVQGDLKGIVSGERWVLEQAEDEANLGEYVID